MVATGPRLPKPIGGDSGGDEPLRISLGEGMMGACALILLPLLHAAAVGMSDGRLSGPGRSRAAAGQSAEGGVQRARVGASLARYFVGGQFGAPSSAPAASHQPSTAP